MLYRFYFFALSLIASSYLSVPVYGSPAADSLSSKTSHAFQLLRQDKPEAAASLYREILVEYSDIDEGIESKRSLMKVYNNLGYIYLFVYHSPERAYPLLLKARDLAKEYGQNDLLAAAYDNIAKLYDDFGDTQDALKNFRASFQSSLNAETDVAHSIRLMAFDDLANFAIHRECIDSIEESIMLYDKYPKSDIPMSQYTNELASSLKLVNRKKYKDAYAILEKAGGLINPKVDTVRYQVNHQLALSALADFAGNKSRAIEHLDSGLNLITASASNLSDLKVRLYNRLSRILSAHGQEARAKEYRLMALELTDSLYYAKKFGNIRDIESMVFIDELNKNAELSALELKLQWRQIWILSVATIVILLLFIGLGIYTKKLNKTHLALVKRHKESLQQREVELRLFNELSEKVRKQEQPNPESLSIKSYSEEGLSLEQNSHINTDKSGAQIKIPGNTDEHLKKIEEIKTIFSTSNEIYDSSFSLNRLAELLGSKPKYISILINGILNSSFSQLLAEARVAESCRLLLDDEIGAKITIEAVAEKVGYRSRTHFISIFSKITGLTPTQYIKASKKSV